MPAFVALPLEMSVEQRAALEVMARSESLPFRRVRQAGALLLAADWDTERGDRPEGGGEG